ncbi:uncharacterized protein [Amphiura filiformis]|uniref:uncharacterized protein n=1 Tax=Amphiura filiformis TaxID=82378 RepID=UPI003B21494A
MQETRKLVKGAQEVDSMNPVDPPVLDFLIGKETITPDMAEDLKAESTNQADTLIPHGSMGAMTKCHRDVLRKVRVYMMENLEVDTIIQNLVGERLLTAADEDFLSDERTARARTKALLDILPRKGDVGYTKLLIVLREEHTSVYQKLVETEHEIVQSFQQPIDSMNPVDPPVLDFLIGKETITPDMAEDLKAESTNQADTLIPHGSMGAMTKCHRDVLRKVRVYMMENLEVDTIIQNLVGELLLTAADEDNLSAERTARAKTKALLDILPRKGDVGYTKLLSVLREEQTFVYQKLVETEQEIARSVQQSRPMGLRFVTTQSASLQFQQPSGIYSQPVLTDSGPSGTAKCIRITSSTDTGQVILRHMKPRSPLSLVSTQALSTLATNLGSEWEQLAIHMGFPTSKLYHWKQENSTVWGQVFAMLDSWKNHNANNATIAQLLAVLMTFKPPLSQSVYRHLYFE